LETDFTLPGRGPRPIYRLRHLAGQTRPFPDAGEVAAGDWVFWYPEFTGLGLDGSAQEGHVRESGLTYLPVHTRRQVKHQVYSHLDCLVLIPRDDADAGAITRTVREGLRRFGGRAVVFTPAGITVRERVG
jgi:hypothetical protein